MGVGQQVPGELGWLVGVVLGGKGSSIGGLTGQVSHRLFTGLSGLRLLGDCAPGFILLRGPGDSTFMRAGSISWESTPSLSPFLSSSFFFSSLFLSLALSFFLLKKRFRPNVGLNS